MKRIVCMILILLMLIPPMAVSAEGDPSITIAGAEGRVGDTVQVVVAGANLPACASMELILQYDATVLKPTAHAKGNLSGLYIGNLEYDIRESDGIGRVGESAIKIACASSSNTTPLLSGNPTLVTLTFEILADPGPEGAYVSLRKYSLSKMDAELSKVTGIPLPTGYVFAKGSIKSISIKTAPIKTTYIEGQPLDLTGGVLTAIYNDGETADISLTDPSVTVTGFDNTKVGTQKLTATYGGFTAQFEVTILAKSITGIAVTKLPTKTIYLEGKDAFDPAGGKITVTYNDGDTAEVDLSAATVTGFDNTIAGTQKLTATYGGFTAQFNVTVQAKAILGIEVTTPPTKTAYLEGKDAFDPAGGKITVTYDNGNTAEIDLSAATIIGFDHTQVGPRQLTATYQGFTAPFEVTILAKSIAAIAVTKLPAKTVYLEGKDAFSPTDGKITVTYNNGDTTEVDLSAATITGFDNTIAGTLELTATYQGFTAKFNVTILSVDQAPTVCISGGEGVVGQTITVTLSTLRAPISGGFQLEFSYDSSLLQPIAWTDGLENNMVPNNNALGAVPGVLKLAGIYEVPFEGAQTLGTITFRLLAPGTAQILLEEGFFTGETYGGTSVGTYTAVGSSNPIQIQAKEMIGMAVTELPAKTVYMEGKDAFDPAGGKITVTYNDGDTAEVDLSAATITGFDNTKVGTQKLTATYGGLTAQFEVTILAKSITAIAVTKLPTKTTYLEGKDAFDLTGGKITVFYDNDTTEEINLSSATVTGFDNTIVGTQKLTATYGGFTAQFEVTVVAKAVESVELISAPDKKVYIQGEALDLTGGKIRVHYNNGDQNEQSITAGMVSGYQPATVGVQILTVTVEGKQAQFSVTVLSLNEAPTVCISGGEGVVGQTITVALSTLRAPISGGFQLEFSYDPSLLQPIAWTDRLEENVVPNDGALGTVPGVLKLAGLYAEPFSGNQTLGTITFRLLAPGNATVTFVDGFLTGETFGSSPVSQTTVLGKTEPIRIKAKAVERIALIAPNKRIYWMGEGLNFEGSSAVAYFNDGTHQAISPASMTLSGFNNRVGGEQTVTLTYGGKSAAFTVVVLKKHPFTDVSNNIWYYTNQSVPYVYTLGLMNGMTATTFGGEGETTRAQLVTILYRLEGEPALSGDDGFSDVALNDWYYKAVLWASKSGIVTGYPDGTFAPNKSISRAEMAVIFYRYTKDYKHLPTNARANLNAFADRAQIGDWCADAISWAVAEGLMTGMPGNLFAPSGTATRAQIATVLMRYVEKNRV